MARPSIKAQPAIEYYFPVILREEALINEISEGKNIYQDTMNLRRVALRSSNGTTSGTGYLDSSGYSTHPDILAFLTFSGVTTAPQANDNSEITWGGFKNSYGFSSVSGTYYASADANWSALLPNFSVNYETVYYKNTLNQTATLNNLLSGITPTTASLTPPNNWEVGATAKVRLLRELRVNDFYLQVFTKMSNRPFLIEKEAVLGSTIRKKRKIGYANVPYLTGNHISYEPFTYNNHGFGTNYADQYWSVSNTGSVWTFTKNLGPMATENNPNFAYGALPTVGPNGESDVGSFSQTFQFLNPSSIVEQGFFRCHGSNILLNGEKIKITNPDIITPSDVFISEKQHYLQVRYDAPTNSFSSVEASYGVNSSGGVTSFSNVTSVNLRSALQTQINLAYAQMVEVQTNLASNTALTSYSKDLHLLASLTNILRAQLKFNTTEEILPLRYALKQALNTLGFDLPN